MKLRRLGLSLLLLVAALRAGAVSPEYQGATKARVETSYVVVLLADGNKALVPLSALKPDDRAWLFELSRRSPLAPGKSQITVVPGQAAVAKSKQTIEVAMVEGPLETVRLCQPNVLRDQLGGTCMLYARVHWLDIAGYYVDSPAIYRLIANTPPEAPWSARHYVEGLTTIVTERKPQPVVHDLPPEEQPFEWARQELRRGRPILAAFPREIWQALPPGFVAAHPWHGGPVGHQIVINGFTWNRVTQQGTFHIINSWQELPQFDLTTQAAAGGALVIEQSLSPLGEVPTAAAREEVLGITLLRAVGKTNLYEVKTNLGTRRIAAPTEAAARAIIEQAP